MTTAIKNNIGPIAFFCDFGLPYTGQMKAAILRAAPDVRVVDLMVDAPAFDVRASSILLAAMAESFPAGTIFVCVVDPDVGSAARLPGAVLAGGRWFVGPLNGIFEHTIRHWPEEAVIYSADWPTENISASFHGRDIFAPMAAKIYHQGSAIDEMTELSAGVREKFRHPEFADDLEQIIYIDGFGNAITGVHAPTSPLNANANPPVVTVGGRDIPWARTFSDVPPQSPFAYANSMNLIELAVNKGRADVFLDLNVGSQVSVSFL